MRNSVALLGIGIITPRGCGVECLRTVPEGAVPAEATDIPPPEGMTARDQRRQARLTRLALYAADGAAAQAGVRGRDAGVYMGLTHGTATFLKEFHDYLFDYGPEMASPNAFSNGVTNAPLGAISLQMKLTDGGATLVGIETCGLEVLNHAAGKVLDGTHGLCFAGAAEEYSTIVDDVYGRLGWYRGEETPYLPCPYEEGSRRGCGLSEGSVVCVLGPADSADGLGYTPVRDLRSLPARTDLVISGAGGGPQDTYELEALRRLAQSIGRPVPILFSKKHCGETFAVGGLLSLAIAWDILRNRAAYPAAELHPALAGPCPGAFDPAAVRSVLVLSCSREGGFAAGLLSRS